MLAVGGPFDEDAWGCWGVGRTGTRGGTTVDEAVDDDAVPGVADTMAVAGIVVWDIVAVFDAIDTAAVETAVTEGLTTEVVAGTW
jgi:hypothetical protein